MQKTQVKQRASSHENNRNKTIFVIPPAQQEVANSQETAMNFGKEEMRRRSARVAVFHIHALVNHILRYCDYSSLSRVSCVCKTLYDFALRAPLWVKLLESHYGSVLSGRISVQNYKKRTVYLKLKSSRLSKSTARTSTSRHPMSTFACLWRHV